MKRNKEFLFVIAIIGFFLIWAAYDTLMHQYYFNHNSVEKRISVGRIFRVEAGAKTPPLFKYSYQVNNTEFEAGAWLDEKIRKKYSNSNKLSELRKNFIGKKFLVIFVYNNPDYSELLWEKPIDDSILMLPKEGWSKPPF